MSDTPIWIVDDIVVRPGQGPAFIQAYREHYAPAAEARGMRLLHSRVEPAMWLDDDSNRLLLIWGVSDVGAVWASKHVARMSPDVDHFWDEIAASLIASRSRAIMAEADQLEVLANV